MGQKEFPRCPNSPTSPSTIATLYIIVLKKRDILNIHLWVWGLFIATTVKAAKTICICSFFDLGGLLNTELIQGPIPVLMYFCNLTFFLHGSVSHCSPWCILVWLTTTKITSGICDQIDDAEFFHKFYNNINIIFFESSGYSCATGYRLVNIFL